MTHLTQQEVRRGFTLVETLVAISILLLVMMGPMTVAQKGIKNAYFANEQVTAVFLAQEAIEGVREYRDAQALVAYPDNLATGTSGWESIFSTCTEGAGGCAYKDGTFITCGSTNNDCILRVDTETGEYSHNSSPDNKNSQFTRKIFIGATDNGGVPVTVKVIWSSQVIENKEVVLQTWIYDHYKRTDF